MNEQKMYIGDLLSKNATLAHPLSAISDHHRKSSMTIQHVKTIRSQREDYHSKPCLSIPGPDPAQLNDFNPNSSRANAPANYLAPLQYEPKPAKRAEAARPNTTMANRHSESDSDKQIVKQIIREALIQCNYQFQNLGQTRVDQVLISASKCREINFQEKKILASTYEKVLQSRGLEPRNDNQIYNLATKSWAKLDYVLRTIEEAQGQDSGAAELKFSVGEIIDQTIALAFIEIQRQRKDNQNQKMSLNVPTTEPKQGSERQNIHKKATLPQHKGQSYRCNSKTFIEDRDKTLGGKLIQQNQSKLIKAKSPNMQKTMPMLPKPQTRNPDLHQNLENINTVNNQQKSRSSRYNSGNSHKPVNFMPKFQNHVEKNVTISNNLSRTRAVDITQYETNFSTSHVLGPNQTHNMAPPTFANTTAQAKPPRPAFQNPNNTQVIIDENTDFLIHNLNQNYRTAQQKSEIMPENNILNTFPESYNFKYDLEPKRLVEPKVKKAESIMDQHLREEEEFRLVLKYMNNWKKYVRIQKQKRSQQEECLKKMMEAIDFYEGKLMKKGWTSMVAYQLGRAQLNQCRILVEKRVTYSLKKFYFKTIRRKYVREQRRKYLKKVAKSYFYESRKFKCLIQWRKVAQKINQTANRIFAEIKSKQPRAAEILLERLAYDTYLGQGQYRTRAPENIYISDIVKFHFFAVNNFSFTHQEYAAKSPEAQRHMQSQLRIRNHLLSRFNESIEIILQSKQQRAFDSWKSYIQSIQKFKHKRSSNLLRDCFFAIKRKSFHKNSIQYMSSRSDSILINACFQRLSQYHQHEAYLKEKSATLRYQRQRAIFKRYFSEWHALYEYFARFTRSQYSYSHSRISLIFFKRKFFVALKNYYEMRRKHNANLIIAKDKYFKRYAGRCFSYWAWFYLHKNKKVKFAKLDVQRKQERKTKLRYFNAFKRAYGNEKKVQMYRVRTLGAKALQSFVCRRQFLELRNEITKICLFKYNQNIIKRGFKSLKMSAKMNIKLSSLENIIKCKQQKKMHARVLQCLQQNLNNRKKKKQDIQFINEYFYASMKRKVFEQIVDQCRIDKELRLKHQVLQQLYQEKLMKKYFLRILCRYNKRVTDKQLGVTLLTKRSSKIKSKHFVQWLRRYRIMKQAEQVLARRTHMEIYSDIFKLWRIKFLLRTNFKTKHKRLQDKVRLRNLRKIFKAFKHRLQYKIRLKKKASIGDYYFLKNRIGKCLSALYAYSTYRKIKRNSHQNYILQRKQKIYNSIKRKWHLKQSLHRYRNDRSIYLMNEIFDFLKKYAKRHIGLQCRHDSIKHKLDMKLKSKAFRVLICPEFYMSKEPRQLEFHEIFILNLFCQKWKNITKVKKNLRNQAQKVKAIVDVRLGKFYLKQWRTELYIKSLGENVALPHLENTINQKLKSQVFKALEEYKNNSQRKRSSIQACDTYYTDSLSTKAIESLRWYANRNIHRRASIQYTLVNKSKKYVIYAFNALKNYKEFQKSMKEKLTQIQFKHQKITEYKLFRIWLAITQNEKLNAPTNNLYNDKILQQAFTALYNNRTFKIIKRTMLKQALDYNTYQMKRKVLETFVWYALIHKKKKTKLNSIATIHFKRRFVNKWIEVLNHVVSVKENITASLQNNNSAIKQLMTIQTQSSLIASIGKPPSQGSTGHFIGDFSSNQKKGATKQAAMMAKPPQPRLAGSHGQPPQPAQIEEVGINTLNIKDLNSTTELRQAHDIMSQHLKSIQANQNQYQQGSNPYNQLEKDQQILKNLISEIKEKYSRQKIHEKAFVVGKADQLEQRVYIGDTAPDDKINIVSNDSDTSMIYDKLGKALDLHRKQLTTKAFLAIKNVQINEEEPDKQEQLRAVSFMNLQLKDRALKSLKIYIDNKHRYAKIEETIRARHKEMVTLFVFNQLSMYVSKQQCKREITAKALYFRQHRALKIGLFAFKKFHLSYVMCRCILFGVQERARARIFFKWHQLALNKRDKRAWIAEEVQNMNPYQDMNEDGMLEGPHKKTGGFNVTGLTLNSNSSSDDEGEKKVAFNKYKRHPPNQPISFGGTQVAGAALQTQGSNQMEQSMPTGALKDLDFDANVYDYPSQIEGNNESLQQQKVAMPNQENRPSGLNVFNQTSGTNRSNGLFQQTMSSHITSPLPQELLTGQDQFQFETNPQPFSGYTPIHNEHFEEGKTEEEAQIEGLQQHEKSVFLDKSLEDSLESLFNNKNRQIVSQSPDPEINHDAHLNTTPRDQSLEDNSSMDMGMKIVTQTIGGSSQNGQNSTDQKKFSSTHTSALQLQQYANEQQQNYNESESDF